MAQLQLLWKVSLREDVNKTLKAFNGARQHLFPDALVEMIFGFYHPASMTLFASDDTPAFGLDVLREGSSHKTSAGETLLLKSGDVVEIRGQSAQVPGTTYPHVLCLAIL